MERTTFLKNYRIRLQYDGTPYQPLSAGPATSYEAVDERTGEPVSVTLIPAASIDPAEREGFEEHISSAQKLQHVNIGSVRDFGREGRRLRLRVRAACGRDACFMGTQPRTDAG